jgi:16S rRNA (uracil1498-N3)-methyltransferase
MSIPRFLVPLLPNQGSVDLPADEAHHASRVLRCSLGDSIVLFDGIGNEAIATILSLDKRSVTAAIRSFAFAPRDHSGRLHFAIAMPKGDRQRNTIEKLVELGVDTLTPLETARSVAVVNDANSERLVRYVEEACKQCGRNRLMSIRPTLRISDIQDSVNSLTKQETNSPIQIWILHPKIDGHSAYSIHAANAIAAPNQSLLFLIGPEGGFSDAEVIEAVQQGARILSLGERIQRVETAASTAAVLGHCWLSE